MSGGFWNFTSLDGEVRLRGMYRQRHTELNGFTDDQQSQYFSGGLMLNTKSYLWHPNFLQIEFGGEFNPESNQDEYLVTPDRAEVRTLKGLNLSTTLFNSKPVTLSSWLNWNDSYSNRENLTNIKTVTTRWGSSLLLNNRILPVNVRYTNTKWDQKEIQTGRTYKLEQGNLEASVQKSFSDRDRHELNYSNNQYYRQDANLFEIRNINNNFRLNNSFFFDQDRRYMFRSMIYSFNRQGSQNFTIFSATENITLKLPLNFQFSGNYLRYNQEQQSYRSDQNKVGANLSHKLFNTLNSRVFYEYSGINHSQYRETRNLSGFNLNYTKSIPTGRFNLSYSHSVLRNQLESDPVDIQIIGEEQLLSDGEIILLNRPYIDINTIIVRDASGTIVYQIDFDYMLIESGDYIEIQRVPGGQIPNASTVYVEYIATQTGSYKYNAVSNSLSANLILFSNLLELYYRRQVMDYRDIEKSDLLILNYIKGNTLGGKFSIWDAEIGAEYEGHNSTITPFKMMRYYANFQKRLNKISVSLHGNIRNYEMLDEHIDRRYSDLSGNAAYQFNPTTKLDFMIGYRKQIGPGIDLDLFTARTEFKTSYRQLYMTVGVNLYLRDYLSDLTNYYGVYIQLVRKF